MSEIKTSIIPPESNVADEIDLSALGRTLWRKKRQIIATSAITSATALVLSFALPKTYIADATILPTSTSDSTAAIAAGISSQLGAAASMLGGLGFGLGKTADLVEILGSRSMAERVIRKCSLDRELKGWKTHSELVNKVKKMSMITAPTLKNKVVDIEIEASRPDLAAAMANAYVSELKDMLDEIGYNNAAKTRKFIEGQLAKTKTELASDEEKLAIFQAKNRLASLPETVVASIKSLSDLEAQRISAQVQLKTTDEALAVIRTRTSSLQADPNSLIELEVKRKGLQAQEAALNNAKEGFLNKLTSLPPKGMELARLQRDVQVQNAVYLALNQQYESAVISESKDSDAFLPLDKAEVPDRPAKPKKLLNALLGFLTGLIIGSAVALLKSRIERNEEGKPA